MTSKRSAFLALLAVLVGLSVTVAAHREFATVPIVVDGAPVRVARAAGAREVAATYGTAAAGDRVARGDGRVLLAGGGGARLVFLNGVAPTGAPIRAGDAVTTLRGVDVREPLVVETQMIDPPVRVLGSGTATRTVVPGVPGTQEIVYGSISGDVIGIRVVAEPSAEVHRMARSASHVLALTFDDGPWPAHTGAILDTLRDTEVRATFFMLGSRAKASPALVRRIAEEGHAPGNHTFRHVLLSGAPLPQVRAEIADTSAMIEHISGVRPKWFRPPGGHLDAQAYEELRRAELRVALWTVDPKDWETGTTAEQIVERVRRTARPGAAILLHDGGGDRTQTVLALPRLIEALRADGYDFVTLDEMGTVRSRW